ncbi:MAG: S8 family serine peptidase [Pirellulaceae bacterium]|nr:S8 family serine peptidase [Pirellulaceae bacterium]
MTYRSLNRGCIGNKHCSKYWKRGPSACVGTVAILLTSVMATETHSQVGQPGVSSSNGGPTVFRGLDINELLGAYRFYDSGWSGFNSIVATVEGTVPDVNHQTMGNVTERFYGTGVSSSYQGNNHNHPTAVSHALSGTLGSDPTSTSYFGYGIAYDAVTWAGAISTGFASDGGYFLTNASTASVYSVIMHSGVGGRTADVINSSWWFGDWTGNHRDTIGVDGLASRTGKLLVNIAGNAGPGPNTVRGFGAGYNGITVGALDGDLGANSYSMLASASGRGPNDVAFASQPNNWSLIESTHSQRATVDLVAPGGQLTLARPSSGPNFYGVNLSGTSFAAPLVAGGAGLVIDAGRDVFGTTQSVDARVVKAVLLNSATQLPGWNNGQTLVGSIVTTTQALDFGQGAGRMNLDAAYDQYLTATHGGQASTADVAGIDQGSLGAVGAVGWDFGRVNALSVNSYHIESPLAGDSWLTATLTWFVDRNPGALADFSGAGEEHFANLDLSVFEFDNLTDRNRLRTVAESISLFNTVEHLRFSIVASGYYGIEVRYTDAHWNFVGQTQATYGLAWHGVAIPNPTSLLLLMESIALSVLFRVRGVSRSVATVLGCI